MAEQKTLYPPITPRESGMLETGDGHVIYWERSGNPNGTPALFLHGGPGGGTTAMQRQFFDPQKYDIILFDQRGSGKSTPHAQLEGNTTQHLVADMELLRETLGIKKWVLFGGSWGSTLALAYTMEHAARVTALVMWGIFLVRQSELHALYFEGGVANLLFPEFFAPYINFLPQEHRADPIKGYRALFDSPDADVMEKALDLWTRLEKKVARLVVPDAEVNTLMADPAHVRAVALIENHYFLNTGFIDAANVLENIGAKTAGIPVHIVQGRYDVVCPFITAWEVHRAVPHSLLYVIDNEGHSAREVGIQAKLVEILDGLAG